MLTFGLCGMAAQVVMGGFVAAARSTAFLAEFRSIIKVDEFQFCARVLAAILHRMAAFFLTADPGKPFTDCCAAEKQPMAVQKKEIKWIRSYM